MMRLWPLPSLPVPRITPRTLFIGSMVILGGLAVAEAINNPESIKQKITLMADYATAVIKCGDKVVNLLGEYNPLSTWLGGNDHTPEALCRLTGNGAWPAMTSDGTRWYPR